MTLPIGVAASASEMAAKRVAAHRIERRTFFIKREPTEYPLDGRNAVRDVKSAANGVLVARHPGFTSIRSLSEGLGRSLKEF
jgi:hypothetical protein